jgi:hypothetical protein
MSFAVNCRRGQGYRAVVSAPRGLLPFALG